MPDSDSGDDRSLLDLLCLAMIPGIGPLTSRALLDSFGSAGKVLSASLADLKRVPGVGPKLAEKIVSARRDLDPEVELQRCRQQGVRPIPFDDPEYPEPLKSISDPPALLYVRGTLLPTDSLAIALVGARKATPYGMRIAERLAGSLARVGLTVVSGLARGIDAAAHRGALRAGGRTIGVLGNGLGSIYPPEHAELAAEVAASGAVVSEQPMEQKPLAGLFPQRNRLIAGLCLGVVVVEAAPRSGSLSSAHHAMEQNREVFAVPGPIDSITSRGCHALIRDGARLVETVDDILEELGPLARAVSVSSEPEAPEVRHPAELSLTDHERAVLGHLDDLPRGIDELIVRTGLAPSQVMATMAILEMRRLIRRNAGNQFTRI
ncbi:DNA-processing protein DprA [Tautonia marina]|uniref:DNA-processing protein DprA n=1 Tax=Tautonia marina TaxID=2653855 RepID=UPI001F30C386|nr:DNA-processing protein DprA [Tautonia marina]